MNPEEFKKGLFTPKNPQKYKGDVNKIVFRSSWEETFCEWCDNNPNVLNWASEEIKIPYISPLDHKKHTYYPDFWIKGITKTGKIFQELIEIKPKKQMMAPTLVGKNKKRQLFESNTFVVNQAKWEAAQYYCSKYGLNFRILTENEIYGKKSQKNGNRNKRSNNKRRTSTRRRV